jgi:signal transduction histidine kinase
MFIIFGLAFMLASTAVFIYWQFCQTLKRIECLICSLKPQTDSKLLLELNSVNNNVVAVNNNILMMNKGISSTFENLANFFTSHLEKIHQQIDAEFQTQTGQIMSTQNQAIRQIVSEASKELRTALNAIIDTKMAALSKLLQETNGVSADIETKINRMRNMSATLNDTLSQCHALSLATLDNVKRTSFLRS